MELRHQIVIVGGGTAGITVAARLLDANRNLDIAVIEPASKHYYQPLWTLVGGGLFPREASEREEADLIPEGVSWIQDAVERFDPEANTVTTKGGKTIGYDYLVVAPGIQIRWDKVKGLKETIGQNGVCSNYSYESVDSTWRAIRDFRGGTAVFTQPAGAVKCGGAPQKIMYLAEDHFRRSGVRDRSRIVFATSTPRIFAVEKYARALEKIIARKSIETRFRHDLIEIRAETKEAVFLNLETKEQVSLPYDMLPVTPPMTAPECVAQSPLADSDGWVDVDKHTLRHVRFPNIFGIGDASNLPTSKTGAAIRKQAPVLVANLETAMTGEPLEASYDGYTSCPIVTSYNSLIMAEFDYDKKPKETFPFDQSQERFSMFYSKKVGLPALYWHGMLRDRL